MTPLGARRDVRVLRGRVVTPEAVLEDGVVVVAGERLAWVGPAAQAPDGVLRLPPPEGLAAAGDGAAGDHAGPARGRDEGADARADVVLLPGLVDLHCHGGAGVGFPDAPDVGTARVAAHEHLRHGTTTLVASLVTAEPATLLARAAVLGELAASGDVAGVHVEGPFLAAARCGAQDPSLVRRGDPGLVRALAEVCGGSLVSMTIAPEVPDVLGADGVLEALVAVGALPSVGHTDATAEVTERALRTARRRLADAGVRGGRPTVTHLFNGMPPLHHRAPGPVAAALAAAARGEAVVELVGDGVHVAPAALRAVVDLVGVGGVALVSDALAATGARDGSYRLGTRAVVVTDGVARLADGGALAGSTAHLLDVVRATAAAGVGLVAAVRAASTTPAAVLGRDDVGALVAGRRADVVVTDADLRPQAVLRAGRTVGALA